MLASSATFFALIIFMVMGIFAGIFFNFSSFVAFLAKKNVIVTFVCDLFACLFACLLFLLAIFKFENGAFAVFEVVSFLIGIAFELIFVKNLIASGFNFVYNKIKFKKKKIKG